MPKQTFFNLGKEKQEILIQAAMKEFSRAPLYEASISNIVKAAGIPRGSFYQYFNDKEDAFLFLLKESSKASQEKFILLLKETDGDLIETFSEMFQSILRDFQDDEKRSFFRNTFLNMNYKVENTFTQNFNEENKERFLEINGLINTNNLNIADKQELLHVIHILLAVTFHNLIQSFTKNLSFEESVQNYLFQLGLLKKGLCKVDE